MSYTQYKTVNFGIARAALTTVGYTLSNNARVTAGITEIQVSVGYADGAMTSSSGVLTSASAVFRSTDVGKAITVTGAGTGGSLLSTTIASYQSATQVTLTAAAGTTVSGATLTFKRNTGTYGAVVTFPDGFAGPLTWDTGQGASTSFATEDINPLSSFAAGALNSDNFTVGTVNGDATGFLERVSLLVYSHFPQGQGRVELPVTPGSDGRRRIYDANGDVIVDQVASNDGSLQTLGAPQ